MIDDGLILLSNWLIARLRMDKLTNSDNAGSDVVADGLGMVMVHCRHWSWLVIVGGGS